MVGALVYMTLIYMSLLVLKVAICNLQVMLFFFLYSLIVIIHAGFRVLQLHKCSPVSASEFEKAYWLDLAPMAMNPSLVSLHLFQYLASLPQIMLEANFWKELSLLEVLLKCLQSSPLHNQIMRFRRNKQL